MFPWFPGQLQHQLFLNLGLQIQPPSQRNSAAILEKAIIDPMILWFKIARVRLALWLQGPNQSMDDSMTENQRLLSPLLGTFQVTSPMASSTPWKEPLISYLCFPTEQRHRPQFQKGRWWQKSFPVLFSTPFLSQAISLWRKNTASFLLKRKLHEWKFNSFFLMPVLLGSPELQIYLSKSFLAPQESQSHLISQ